ncbi:MAG: hypothetical protein CW691_11180 [Candidatus Bathyarchaeum sp.]|nr:MAG: hypothetical protein CW691_11180 [Candidatus Bathyarchaeum sp.]
MTNGTENSKTLEELDTKHLLVTLIGEVHKLNQKFDSVVKFSGKMLKAQEELLQRTPKHSHTGNQFKLVPDMMTLISIPSALRKTVVALYKLQEATADDLSRETKRLRAVESAAANQLLRMGFVSKKREGRKVYFTLNDSETSQ